MMCECPNKPHKNAEVIKAWADGAVIQFRQGYAWWDLDKDQPPVKEEYEYRIKPKPKVKKWRWVFSYIGSNGKLSVSADHYTTAEDLNRKYSTCQAIQKIDSTMIEVEE